MISSYLKIEFYETCFKFVLVFLSPRCIIIQSLSFNKFNNGNELYNLLKHPQRLLSFFGVTRSTKEESDTWFVAEIQWTCRCLLVQMLEHWVIIGLANDK